jgi:hypothetical protein
MALFYECMQQYARKVLDIADIVTLGVKGIMTFASS